MRSTYHVQRIGEKKQAISELLSGYWGKDVWDIRDSFFDDIRPAKWGHSAKTINFSAFSPSIRDEVKYFYASRLQQREVRLSYIIAHGSVLKYLAKFLHNHYPNVTSIVDIPYDKALFQWLSFLVEKGLRIEKIRREGHTEPSRYEASFNQLYSFLMSVYDTRNEYEKDVWDCRKIPGANITENLAHYRLNFSNIPLVFRGLAKRFIQFRMTTNSHSQCRTDIMALRLFTEYIHNQELFGKT